MIFRKVSSLSVQHSSAVVFVELKSIDLLYQPINRLFSIDLVIFSEVFEVERERLFVFVGGEFLFGDSYGKNR